MLRPARATPATLALYGAARSAPDAAFTCSSSWGDRREACLHVAGELDVVTARHLQRTLQAAQEATPHVVVDVRDVTFIGIAGVRVIAAASDRARRAGDRLVVVRGAYAARAFALTGIRNVEFCDIDPGRPDASSPALAECGPRAVRALALAVRDDDKGASFCAQ